MAIFGAVNKIMVARALKYTALVFMGLFLLLAVVAGGLFAWLRTPSGLQWLETQIESSLSAPGQPVTVGKLTGQFPSDLTLNDLRFADQQGVWLSIDQAHLLWHPSDLLKRYVNVEVLEAGTIRLDRLPTAQTPDETTRTLPQWPRLPVGVDVNRLTVQQFILGKEVAGSAATFSIAGQAHIKRGEGPVALDLGINRMDGPAGELVAHVDYAPAANTLNVGVRLNEAAGGILSSVLALPGAPPVTAHLTGNGPLQNWQADLQAKAGEGLSVSGTIGLQQVEDAYGFTLNANAELAPLFPQPIASLFAAHTVLEAKGQIVPDETITLDTVTLNTVAGTAQVSGRLNLEEDQVDLRYAVKADADSAPRNLLADMGWTQVRLEGTAEGSAGFPAISANLTANNLATSGVGVETLTADMALKPTVDGLAAPVPFTLNATARNFSGLPTAAVGVIGPELTIQAKGSLQALANAVILEQATINTAAAQLVAEGRSENSGQNLQGQITLTAPDLGAVSGNSLSGNLEAHADIAYAGTLDSLRADISASGANLHTGIPAIDALVGDRLAVTGRASPSADQGLRIEDVWIETATLTSALNATLVDNRLNAEWTLDVPQLGRLEPLVGQPLEGALQAKGRAEGPLDNLTVTANATAPGMTVAGTNLHELVLDANITGLPNVPAGTVRAKTQYGDRPLTLSGDIATTDTGYLLDRLNAAFGSNSVAGRLTMDGATGLVAGTLDGRLDDLAALNTLVGQPLGGTATFTLNLMATQGQRAQLELQGQNLAFGDSIAASTRLNADVTNAFSDPHLDARLNAANMHAAGANVENLNATATGTLDNLAFTLDASGTAGEAFQVQAAGVQRAMKTTRTVTLDRLQANFAGEPIRLAEPATIAFSSDGLSADAILSAGDGRLALSMVHQGQRIEGTLKANSMPLRLARLANPTLELTGTADMTASIAGTLPRPQGDLQLTITDLRLPESTDAGISAVDGNLTVRLRDGRINAQAAVSTESKRLSLQATAEAPLLFSPETGAPVIPKGDTLTASLSGRVDMAIANDVLAVRGDRMAGTAEIDLHATGAISDPQLAGTVTVSNGSYELQVAGIAVTDINAKLAGSGRALTIQSFTAKTPGGGTLSLEGDVNLSPATSEQLALHFKANNARVVQTDLAIANISADIDLAGSFANALASGHIKVERAEIRVPERLPPDVVKLDVIEINGGKAAVPAPSRKPVRTQTATIPAPAEVTAGPAVHLDIDIEAPNQVFVTGRGLNVELAGQLDVLGTVDKPRIEGALNLVNGTFDFLGKQLTFQRGTITFTGDGSLEPVLDLTATAKAGDENVDIGVTGRVTSPAITFSSSSGLPEDELLARLLFGKSLTQLSALEAIQLAQSAAELAGFGGGAGILDSIRTELGIDRLEITSGEGSNGVEGASVAAGRYLSDQVYVGVEQGLNDTRVTVELDVTKNIQLEVDAGIETAPSVGVQFEWEY